MTEGKYWIVTGYSGTETDVIIPSIDGGLTVTAIAEGAFEGNISITSVRIPASVMIGDYAFGFCISLAAVTPSALLS